MSLQVESEIGRLRRVLVHRPGREIDWMVPAMMEQLLFDDILDGVQARREHDHFREILRRAGVEVLDPEALLAEVLAEEGVREALFFELEGEYGVERELLQGLVDLEAGKLAAALIGGVRMPDHRPGSRRHRFFQLDPLPNYFFQRDPQFVLGDRVGISSMATDAREREPLVAKAVFSHHPHLAGHGGLFEIDQPFHGEAAHRDDMPYPTVEGGDVLVLSREIVLVGMSARTNRAGVEVLAEYLRSEATPFRHLLLVELPQRRSYMHLDTVFTLIDRGVCLAYEPIIEPGRPESARVYHVDLGADRLAFSVRPSLLTALGELGMELEVVPCGGGDPIHQQREQWTDGANAFALAPGVILLYRRNRRTVEELERRGWRVLRGEEVLADGAEVLGDGPGGRSVITLTDHELSRARGGPRCMTMPLEREPLESG